MVLATLWAVCDTAVASHPNKTFVVFNLLFVFLPMLHSLQDISFPNRDQTQPLAVKVQSPNRWTTRGFPPPHPLTQQASLIFSLLMQIGPWLLSFTGFPLHLGYIRTTSEPEFSFLLAYCVPSTPALGV